MWCIYIPHSLFCHMWMTAVSWKKIGCNTGGNMWVICRCWAHLNSWNNFSSHFNEIFLICLHKIPYSAVVLSILQRTAQQLERCYVGQEIRYMLNCSIQKFTVFQFSVSGAAYCPSMVYLCRMSSMSWCLLQIPLFLTSAISKTWNSSLSPKSFALSFSTVRSMAQSTTNMFKKTISFDCCKVESATYDHYCELG